jgi:acyl-CoA thioester hydrolase
MVPEKGLKRTPQPGAVPDQSAHFISTRMTTMPPTPPETPPFELTLQVGPEAIDELGHVNNVHYLRWVQQAAEAHWQLLAPAEDQQRIAWVVLRHEIDYKRPALPAEDLIARTWVGSATRLSYERHTQILRAADREVLAVARTLWCPIDRQSHRPSRISPAARALFSTPAESRGVGRDGAHADHAQPVV